MLFLDIPEPMDGKLRQKILRRQKWKRAVKWGIAAFVVVLLFINFKFFISPHTKDFFQIPRAGSGGFEQSGGIWRSYSEFGDSAHGGHNLLYLQPVENGCHEPESV